MISTITFEHGKNTCAIEPGVFCQWQGAMSWGTRSVCMLFQNEPLHDKDGWLQRCKQCVETFGTKEPE
jgi:hypothetical protein